MESKPRWKKGEGRRARSASCSKERLESKHWAQGVFSFCSSGAATAAVAAAAAAAELLGAGAVAVAGAVADSGRVSIGPCRREAFGTETHLRGKGKRNNSNRAAFPNFKWFDQNKKIEVIPFFDLKKNMIPFLTNKKKWIHCTTGSRTSKIQAHIKENDVNNL